MKLHEFISTSTHKNCLIRLWKYAGAYSMPLTEYPIVEWEILTIHELSDSKVVYIDSVPMKEKDDSFVPPINIFIETKLSKPEIETLISDYRNTRIMYVKNQIVNIKPTLA